MYLLASNPTAKFKRELKSLIDEGFRQEIVNKKEKAYLVPSVPVMYYLQKIHKNLSKPPGRPIISGIDSVTARIGRYVDEFLQPLGIQSKSLIYYRNMSGRMVVYWQWLM